MGEQTFAVTLRVLAAAIVGISLVHVLFGVSAEPWLGAQLSAASMSDPNLDSQNRFYGAAFTLFAVTLWLSSTDVRRYVTLLNLTLIVFFLAGTARLLSGAMMGWPSPQLLFLTAIELIGPPLIYLWRNAILE